jgi:hypothetical protein
VLGAGRSNLRLRFLGGDSWGGRHFHYAIEIPPGLFYVRGGDELLVGEVGGKQTPIAEIVDLPRHTFTVVIHDLEGVAGERDALAPGHLQTSFHIGKGFTQGKGSQPIPDGNPLR